MTMTDPISDLLTRIRNAHIANHDLLDVPASNVKMEICRILTEQGYLAGFAGLQAGPSRLSGNR